MGKSSKQLTRRSFLKTTAMVVGAATVGAATLTSSIGCTPTGGTSGGEVVEEKTFSNWCRGNCGSEGRCCIDTKVREGKIVSTRQRVVPDNDASIQSGCVKCAANPQRIYGTHRLLYPMLQTGERGSDNWERISWDEAISLIAEKMQAAFDEYGPESVGFMSSYGGNSGLLSGPYTGFTNFPQARGAAGIGPERFYRKTGVTLFNATADSGEMYMQLVQLSSPSNSSEDLINAKTIVNWGSNPCDSTRTCWSRILDAKANGAKVITIDPRFSNSAAHSDQWVPVRPATDNALMLAMCKYIIDNDLIDHDYLRNKSVAPLLIKEDGSYLRISELGIEGKGGPITSALTNAVIDPIAVWDEENNTFASQFDVVDPAVIGTFDANGIKVRPVFDLVKETVAPYTVEFAAEECDLPAETIEGLAKVYATEGPVFTFLFCGMQHYQNGWRIYYALALLVSLTGNACKPGTNYSLTTGQTALYKTPTVDSTEVLAVEDAKLSKMASLNRVPEIIESGKFNGEDYTLRMLWIGGCNAIANGIGYDAQIEAWKKVDFVVVADSFMTDTAKQASLVLPVPMTFEAEELILFLGYPSGYMNQKAIDPIGESKTDFEIFVALAKAMGYDDLYDKDAEGYLRALLDTEENIAAGLGYDDLHEKGAINVDKIEIVENVAQEYNDTFRTQFYLEVLTPNGNPDVEVTILDRMPYYEKAFEAYRDNPAREQYPLFGVSYHDNYTGQSMHSNVPWLNELRGYQGEPYIFIHETAAAERGIVTGDMVKVFNERGYAVLRAVTTKGIREDTINLPRGYEDGELVDGHLQSLTSIESRDRITNNDTHNDWLCQVEKV